MKDDHKRKDKSPEESAVETRYFIAPDHTLLSIWELIEEDKLDEASDLIEKARESKNANYVSRMPPQAKASTSTTFTNDKHSTFQALLRS